MQKQCGHEGACACQVSDTAGQAQAFAPHPFPAQGTPGPPAWAAAPPRRKGRRTLFAVLGVLVVAVVVAATAVVTLQFSGDDAAGAVPVAANGAPAPAGPPATPAGPAPANAAAAGPRSIGDGNLREGAVYVQSNDETANEVVAFARKQDGTLREVGRYPTGGTGTGSFEDSAQGIVLGTSEAEASPIQNVDRAELLFVANAGSGSISVFRVQESGLELVGQTPSGGKRPVSLTVNRGLLYVLNSGEEDRRLILGPTSALENCGHGDLPSVTGFRVGPDGVLQAIEDSTRQLSGRARSGCAQVSFTPDGRTLVVSERIASLPGQAKEGKGAFDLFDVRYDGTLGRKQQVDPSGAGPFGFNFTKDGKLVSSEQNGGLANPGGGHAATYEITGDRTLKAVNGSVSNAQTDSCWVAITDDQKFAFVSSPFNGGIISSYRLGADGSLTLAQPVATAPDGKDANNDVVGEGTTDMTLSRDSQFLYQLNSFTGSLWVFKVGAEGLLSFVEQHQVFQLQPFGKGGEAAPFGIAAF
ncbi:beta-propeller fold lactonase family protein [Amycolatopsis sp. A133]|uniref:beta-propeller fold lactonase family protein n=1 Tax=Amycolatopsis sp. A133 TaxID=3064472 RepID=UPI0027F5D584|nr:beta-propeller fold lactonase family protein [Amycolatopsis sp. A133]MDQ7808735.1 beta-propeller fold lactonase family protein [Amycolatopsis sp. A133]